MATSDVNSSIAQRIAAWRTELSGGGMRTDELDELQSHLEDSLNELLAMGLTETEAWMLAIQRMGSTNQLRDEYQKLEASRGNILSQLCSWILTLFLLYVIVVLTWEMFIDISNIGTVRILPTILLLILLAGVFGLIGKRKIIARAPFLGVFIAAIFIGFSALVLGFITSYEGPTRSKNENPVFEKHALGSTTYQEELISVFTRVGTENLYYVFKSYFSENGQHYILTEVVGRNFIAEFPINITNSNHPIMKNMIRVEGKSYCQCEMQGLKFEIKTLPSGPEFIFKDIRRFAD